jgi:hypothetical protein
MVRKSRGCFANQRVERVGAGDRRTHASAGDCGDAAEPARGPRRSAWLSGCLTAAGQAAQIDPSLGREGMGNAARPGPTVRAPAFLLVHVGAGTARSWPPHPSPRGIDTPPGLTRGSCAEAENGRAVNPAWRGRTATTRSERQAGRPFRLFFSSLGQVLSILRPQAPSQLVGRVASALIWAPLGADRPASRVSHRRSGVVRGRSYWLSAR